jgi:hypothetical protein
MRARGVQTGGVVERPSPSRRGFNCARTQEVGEGASNLRGECEPGKETPSGPSKHAATKDRGHRQTKPAKRGPQAPS